MPEISIIVPVYKVEPYLRRCVDSILAQTFTDFELILVDDGSPEQCGEICDEYTAKDDRIEVIHKSNGGLSSARNAGLNMVTGNYIMFCDSDDWVASLWCEIMHKAAERYQNHFIVHDVIRVKSDDVFYLEINDSVSIIEYYELYKMGISAYAWNKIYENEIIQRNLLRFDETCFFAEDVGFNCNYLKYVAQETIFVHSKLYYYYSNSESIMNKYYSNWMQLHLPLFYLRIPYMNNHISEYCDIWTYRFIHMLDDVFDERNKMTFFQKLRYNQRMLNSKEVRFCFEHASWEKESPIQKRILKMYNYYIYFAFQKTVKFMKRIKR